MSSTDASSILITGGAGYIGSHTAKLLSASGFKPITVDDLSTGVAGRVRWGPFVEASIADGNAIGQALDLYGIKTVIHLAASAQVGESMAHPERYFKNNVTATLALLDTMIAGGVKRLVFGSSCSVYGIMQSTVAREDDPAIPLSPYGESKLMVEKALHWYERAHGLQWVALRYFNVAGVERDSGLGENAERSTRVIPRAVSSALGSGEPFGVLGTDHATPDGTAVRDYVHVSDVAAANLAAVRYLDSDSQSLVANIGLGVGVSVRQIVDEVGRAVGHPVEVLVRPPRPGDPACVVAETERSRRILAWMPKHSTLREIVESALDWHRSVAVVQGHCPKAASDV